MAVGNLSTGLVGCPRNYGDTSTRTTGTGSPRAHFPADVNLAARAADPGFAGPGGCSANRPTVSDDVHRLDQIVEHLRALWIIKIHSVDQNLCSLQARDAKQKL